MRLSAYTLVAICATVASSADLNFPSVISEFYPSETPKIDGKASTSLAEALHSIQSTWQNSNKFTSARNAIYSAAPTGEVQSSLAKSGWNYGQVTTQKWYKDVPQAQKTDIADYRKAIDSAAAKIIGTPGKSKNGCMPTGVPMMMGAVGVVGGVVMAAM
ncbi:uncharacterized protein RAG0_16166 [Rhynchosporium agropyri]|uniref:Uncharacterized protein n=1 Tax=Rhynchosporium agropyri TaxID=914238 RepID=A0A1E1LP86_9HELO|nr:uncharacterized protein RAG0_16166 [Rhynchosporium agropyri]